jgi:hypothetical protein
MGACINGGRQTMNAKKYTLDKNQFICSFSSILVLPKEIAILELIF